MLVKLKRSLFIIVVSAVCLQVILFCLRMEPTFTIFRNEIFDLTNEATPSVQNILKQDKKTLSDEIHNGAQQEQQTNEIQEQIPVNKTLTESSNTQTVIDDTIQSIQESHFVSNASPPRNMAVVNHSNKKSLINVPILNTSMLYSSVSNWYNGRPENTIKSKISCKKLIAGDPYEIKRSYGKAFSKRRTSTEGLINATKDCKQFVNSRGYITKVTSQEENDFPIAFTILMYRDPEQVERLLRAIYRPHNYYCIHVDKKTAEVVHKAMHRVVGCLHNVFIAPTSIKVFWGTIGTLKADMICMELLWKISKKWKYYINLTGQEFPLKTNYELVKILQAYNGSNLIGGKVRKSHGALWKTKPPHGLQAMKGSFHIIASRGYVDYVMTSPIAEDLLYWCERNVKVPDETFYSTLNYNPKLKVPGSYKQGNPGSTVSHIRYKVWYNKRRCAGRMVRGICVFGVGDLKVLTNRTEQFANKFQYQYQPMAYDCMEEWLNEKVRREYAGYLNFNNSFYKTLPHVVNKM